jgi:hypothetical protein
MGAFVILAIIFLALGVIGLVRSIMQFRDRPGVFIFGVLCLVAAMVFFILVLVTPQGPSCGNASNNYTCVSPNP